VQRNGEFAPEHITDATMGAAPSIVTLYSNPLASAKSIAAWSKAKVQVAA
jgi:hypothetical protein